VVVSTRRGPYLLETAHRLGIERCDWRRVELCLPAIASSRTIWRIRERLHLHIAAQAAKCCGGCSASSICNHRPLEGLVAAVARRHWRKIMLTFPALVAGMMSSVTSLRLIRL